MPAGSEALIVHHSMRTYTDCPQTDARRCVSKMAAGQKRLWTRGDWTQVLKLWNINLVETSSGHPQNNNLRHWRRTIQQQDYRS
jgi:hypothetical protein